ncbi:hypothetical protein AOLI_G00011730 [Acnodon oligacanthus]
MGMRHDRVTMSLCRVAVAPEWRPRAAAPALPGMRLPPIRSTWLLFGACQALPQEGASQRRSPPRSRWPSLVALGKKN